MNSPFAQIFLALQQHIATNAAAIKYTDQDLGQLKPGSRPPVSWPCVLIDFEDFNFSDLGQNVQAATGVVVIRLGFQPISNSSQATPTAYLQQAIGYYDIEWALHTALQGWSPGDAFGRFCRVSAGTQKRNDSYRVREIRYSLAFEDYSTQYLPGMAHPAVVISDEIVL